MPLTEITKAIKLLTITNVLLFAGAFISAVAIPLSIRANNKVQELKDRAQTVKDREAARQRIEDQRKIDAANLRVETADSKAWELRADLNRAMLRQKDLERRNQELTSSVQEEHNSRLQLEAKVSARHLTHGQIETLRTLLLPFRGSSIAFTRIQDQEAWEFADDILRPLYLAGWRLSDNDVGIFAPPQYGILLCVPEHRESDPVALALAAALRQAQIDFSVQIIATSELRLIVGLKPASS